jgi:tungstate transport system ATP-binding protein
VAEVKGLQVAYDGRLVLDVPHLAIERGETLTLIGPNGSGKSTLLRVLALLQRPAKGEVFLDGERVDYRTNLLAYRRRLALVMQQPLLRHASTFENVATGLRFRWAARREVVERVNHWLSRLGIAHLAGHNARTLSGGEAQRVSLARALALGPELLLLDEPFADLDTPTREGLLSELRPLLRESRTTTLFVTHDRNEALRLADRMAVMMGGRIHQIGPCREVFSRPVSQEVAAFIGTETIVPGRVVGESQGLLEVEVAPGRKVVALGSYPQGREVLVCIRPEDITLVRQGAAEQTSARNRIPGRVTGVEDLGSFCRVSLDCGFPLVSYATRASVSELSLAESQSLLASFKATAVHIIPQ